ncbi:hypothetical protein BC835DRAFT_1308485 [Cytidiella melzeri]|nr:hypothetical protein BC835DRAFT_1308485 [Cytidiella melzeri]
MLEKSGLCWTIHVKQAPQAPQIALRQWQDMINVPRIGHNHNFYFYVFQLNLAPASAAHSYLPSDFDPGCFYVLAIRVLVELTPLLNVYFCGRLCHGGTPPLAPHGQEPIFCIASGDTRHALAAINPDGDPLHLSPEMTRVYLDNLAQNQRANAAADGLMTMHPKLLCCFYFRAMAQLTATLLGQLPADLNVHFDREAYLKSITAHLSDRMFSTEGFDLGPNGLLHQPDAAVVAQRLAVCKAVMGDLFTHHAPAIPDIVTSIPTAQDNCKPGRIHGRLRRSGVIQSSGISKAKAVDRTAGDKKITKMLNNKYAILTYISGDGGGSDSLPSGVGGVGGWGWDIGHMVRQSAGRALGRGGLEDWAHSLSRRQCIKVVLDDLIVALRTELKHDPGSIFDGDGGVRWRSRVFWQLKAIEAHDPLPHNTRSDLDHVGSQKCDMTPQQWLKTHW